MSVSLGTLAITANTKATFGAPPQGVKAILIGNESGLTCTITMEGGNVQKTLYPSSIDWFPVKPGFNGNVLINPTALLNNTSSWPSSSLIFDAIGLNDPEDASQYPLQLNRNTNVGNTIGVTGLQTQTLINNANAVGTTVINVEPTGYNYAILYADNSGKFQVWQNIDSSHTKQLFIVDPTSGNVVQLANIGLTAQVLGSLQVDQNATITGTTSLDAANITTDGAGNITFANAKAIKVKDSGGTVRSILTEDSSNQVKLQAAGANNILFTDNSGTTLGRFDGNGFAQIVGHVSLDNGNITTDGAGNVTAVKAITSTGNVSTSGNISTSGTGTLSIAAAASLLSTLAVTGAASFSAAINPNVSGVVATGSVSGTATLYEFFQGNVKAGIIVLNNYKSAAGQNLALPTAIASGGCWFFVTELQGGNVQFLAATVAQTASCQTGFGSASAGTQVPETTILGWSMGHVRTAFDTIKVTSTTSGTTGIVVFIGN